MIATEIIEADATPPRPIVLDQEIKLPATSRSIVLVLQDPEGRRIGEVARFALSNQ